MKSFEKVRNLTKKWWIFVSDQLNTHKSESLVRMIAKRCNLKDDLWVKWKSWVLKNMETRKKFLTDKSHNIRFVFTPKHCSWLNQIEMWFGVISKKFLNRWSFKSKSELKDGMIRFINYFNKTLAKPYKWTFSGLPLR